MPATPHRASHPLSRRIANHLSGIYVELPEGWDGFEAERGINLLRRSTDEIGVLMFCVEYLHLAEEEDFPVLAQWREGEYDVYDLDCGDEDKLFRMWETATKLFSIRFYYVCDEQQSTLEMDTVHNIIKSLVKDAATKNTFGSGIRKAIER